MQSGSNLTAYLQTR